MAIVVVPCGVTLGEVCCVLAMMFEVVMVKESEGSGGCSAGGPLSSMSTDSSCNSTATQDLCSSMESRKFC